MTRLFESLDPRFSRLMHGSAGLERLWTGGRWCEGPAWMAAGKYLVWSDIPNDRVLRWDATDGSVSTFEEPARNQNGHTVDHEGRLIACEHRGRCVSRIEHDGSRRVLADSFDGKRLNSPNDAVVKSDGSIWFTDPSYGIDSDYEGDASPQEQDIRAVYRIAPTGGITRVVSDMLQPNGLAFSPDESLLYIADTGRTHDPNHPAEMRVYKVEGDRLGEGWQFSRCDSGLYDGFRVDSNGNIWTSAGPQVHVHAPDGTLIGRIFLPEGVANLTFGGPKRNRLFITATTSLYALYVNARAAV